jgi:hypothetical protein
MKTAVSLLEVMIHPGKGKEFIEANNLFSDKETSDQKLAWKNFWYPIAKEILKDSRF